MATEQERGRAIANTTTEAGENPLSNTLVELVNSMDAIAKEFSQWTLNKGSVITEHTMNIPVLGNIVHAGSSLGNIGAGVWQTAKNAFDDMAVVSNAVGQRMGLSGRLSNRQLYIRNNADELLTDYNIRKNDDIFQRFAHEGLLGAIDARRISTGNVRQNSQRGIYDDLDKFVDKATAFMHGKTEITAPNKPLIDTSAFSKHKGQILGSGVAISAYLMGQPVSTAVAAGFGSYYIARGMYQAYKATKAENKENTLTHFGDFIRNLGHQVREYIDTATTVKPDYNKEVETESENTHRARHFSDLNIATTPSITQEGPGL